eukprot:GHVS01103792.1.p1 GENE.GHVS01103792.1~~GHVS01103792.1.p1  ORF type:complete len:211 (+),score=30.82 GHVS01103792.1:120-752(+)
MAFILATAIKIVVVIIGSIMFAFSVTTEAAKITRTRSTLNNNVWYVRAIVSSPVELIDRTTITTKLNLYSPVRCEWVILWKENNTEITVRWTYNNAKDNQPANDNDHFNAEDYPGTYATVTTILKTGTDISFDVVEIVPDLNFSMVNINAGMSDIFLNSFPDVAFFDNTPKPPNPSQQPKPSSSRAQNRQPLVHLLLLLSVGNSLLLLLS